MFVVIISIIIIAILNIKASANRRQIATTAVYFGFAVVFSFTFNQNVYLQAVSDPTKMFCRIFVRFLSDC